MSKKWWDDEISTQLQITKRDPPTLYNEEAKTSYTNLETGTPGR